MLQAPPRPPRARTQQPQPRAHGPSRAQPRAWRRSVSPPKAPHAPNMAPLPGAPRRWLERGTGPGRPRGPELGERPPGRRPSSAGAAHRGPRSPARLGSDPHSEPPGRQGQKSYLGAAGRPGAPRRGDQAGAGVLLGGAQETPRGRKPQLRAPPPPFAGGTEAPRSCSGAHAQTPREGGQPRPGFPPVRGRGPPQFFRTPRLSSL